MWLGVEGAVATFVALGRRTTWYAHLLQLPLPHPQQWHKYHKTQIEMDSQAQKWNSKQTLMNGLWLDRTLNIGIARIANVYARNSKGVLKYLVSVQISSKCPVWPGLKNLDTSTSK